MKLTVFLAWYDMWIGAFWSKESRSLYVCPLPCLVFKLTFRSGAGKVMR